MKYLEINKVHQGDAPTLLKQIEPETITLSVWSPPYFVGKEYEKHLDYDAWKLLLSNTIKSHYEILKPGGFLVVNIADILCFPDENIPKFQTQNISLRKLSITREDVLKAKQENPDMNRHQLAKLLGVSEQTIDRRLNGVNIRGGKYSTMTRVHIVAPLITEPAYEAGLFLYDRRIWKKDAAWINSKWHNSSYRSVDEFEYLYFLWKPGPITINRKKLSSQDWTDWASRAVWSFPSVRANNDHEAKFPKELPSRCIKLLTEKDDTILDCFMGSGTTAVAAIENDRNYIGIELLNNYVKLSNQNIKIALEGKRQLRLL